MTEPHEVQDDYTVNDAGQIVDPRDRKPILAPNGYPLYKMTGSVADDYQAELTTRTRG